LRKDNFDKRNFKRIKVGAEGFYTSEIRKGKERVGFEIISLDGKRGILAHKDLKSKFKVSKYGVNIEDLDRIGTESILRSNKEKRV
jgi:nucleoside-triphosphatase